MLQRCSTVFFSAYVLCIVSQIGFSSTRECNGPFTSTKYPYPRLAIIDIATRCYKAWTVTTVSPEDVRCAFMYPSEVPTTPPEKSYVLTPESYDDFLQVAELGQVNTIAASTERLFLIGFKNDTSPSETGAKPCP